MLTASLTGLLVTSCQSVLMLIPAAYVPLPACLPARFKSLLGSADDILRKPETSIAEKLKVGGWGGSLGVMIMMVT
jgi:hypothetical protein